MSVDEFLKERTELDAQFWMDQIGALIHHRTDPETKQTDVQSWVMDLGVVLWNAIRDMPIYDWKVMDENIVMSSLLSVILSLWSCRIIRAKSYDKRRPLEARQGMMRKLLVLQHALFECTVDEAHDHEYFPKQEWDSPFLEGQAE